MRRGHVRGRGALLWLVLAALVASPSAPIRAVAAPVGTVPRGADTQLELVAGGTPTELTIAVSRRRFARPAPAAVLTRDDVFVDALAGSGLLGSRPLLATPTRGLAPAVVTELRRVTREGAPVLLLGGELALSRRVADQVRALGRTPVRLAGRDREATAAAIALAQADGATGGTVVLARGWPRPGLDATSGWVDAIAVGAWAADTGTPLLLADDGLPPATAGALRRLRPARVVVVGGEAAVSAAAATRAARIATEFGGQVVRVAGVTRGDTAVAIAVRLWGHAPADGTAVAVRGDAPRGWVAGLAGAGLGADLDAPVVLAGDRHLLGTPGCPPRVVGLGVTPELTRTGLELAVASACERATALEAGVHDYAGWLPDGTPFRYDHCRPVRVAANFTDAPANARSVLDAALAEVRRHGVDVRYVGTTTRRATGPLDDVVGGLRDDDGSWRPVVVSWPPAGTWAATSSVGYASSTYVGDYDDTTRYVTGSVQLDPTWQPGSTLFTQLLLHELGHVLGLAHVDDRAQLMNPIVGAYSPPGYGPGDRAGLAGLLAAPC